MGERGPQKHGREMGCMGGEDPSYYLTGALEPVEEVAQRGGVGVKRRATLAGQCDGGT